MSKSRRIATMVALATAAVTVAATPAAATPLGGPQPASSWLRAVKAHSDSWVNIYWRTTGPSCDVKVKVVGRGVAVSYPGHRRFVSLSRGTMLRPSRPDYTPISVDPDFGRPGVAMLKTSIAFNDCTRHARTQYRNFTLTLPVQRNHNWPGPVTTSASASAGPSASASPSVSASPSASASPNASASPATTSAPVASPSASPSRSDAGIGPVH